MGEACRHEIRERMVPLAIHPRDGFEGKGLPGAACRTRQESTHQIITVPNFNIRDPTVLRQTKDSPRREPRPIAGEEETYQEPPEKQKFASQIRKSSHRPATTTLRLASRLADDGSEKSTELNPARLRKFRNSSKDRWV